MILLTITGCPKLFQSQNFDICEFVSRETLNNYGQLSQWFIDERCLITAEAIKKHFGNRRVRINDWKWKGQFNWRGYRIHGCGVGKPNGQHYFGRAIDFDIEGLDCESVRQEIIVNHKKIFQHVTAIELDTKSWVHVDFRWNPDGGLLKFLPS